MTIKYIDELDIADKRVFIRLDLNVPLDDEGNITGALETLQRVKAEGGRLLICGINPQLTRVFRITHLDKLFDFYETTEAAVAALHTA